MFGVIPLSVALFAVSSVVTGTPTPRAMTVHDQRVSAPNRFVKTDAADPQANLNFRIGLTPKDIDGLEKALFAVSEPDSDLYGQHLSFDEVKAFSAPTSEAVTAVTNWLADNGITDVKTSGAFDDWLTFTIPVEKANTLLSAQYETFVHTQTGEQLIRTLTASIPSDLTDFIEVVHPTTSFAKPTFGTKPVVSIPITSNLTERANPAPSACNSIVTPACLQALYGIPATRATQSTNHLGVSGFIDQFAQTADLRTFLTNLRPDIPSTTTFTLQTLDGGRNVQSASQAGIEANLDIQYTIGVATGVPTFFISVGDSTTDGLDGFLDIINFLLAETSPPQVLTTSYGFDETDLPASAATRLCNAYMALGARGVSILFASGDGGVGGGQQGETCTNFIPAFPGGCPFHTAVGATQGVTETSASFSSGGFSNVFARPSYQASAVSTYLDALGNTNAGRFNAAGRGFPDVAAQGNNVEIVVGGRAGLVGGTSCSSPIFASIISLINDRLIAAGKPVLGFLNPFLYANPSAFFDITTGDNPGCGTNGFPARAGWDPVTGLGTPNFAALLAAAGL
ncbi:family S53 protease-like protein [Desarmillaria tabescens]|uniref:tripeptidyl-peptidase II n=1 Tax=Armillaria tabescens TaxID=1929756 RepID=A0AA39JV95_ARMTA|nr:family S53 protease-like protein [Desarmillaria tabescens]KAK0449571.1 family S53 protease-like protein [Desarmillaria tabescens]